MRIFLFDGNKVLHWLQLSMKFRLKTICNGFDDGTREKENQFNISVNKLKLNNNWIMCTKVFGDYRKFDGFEFFYFEINQFKMLMPKL